ncbi:uncharacterized protein TNCV_3111331 [Trichonephila clavipes]|nr:uncharacterized protein TNCV_3111331 [Trichonephila clavipes]
MHVARMKKKVEYRWCRESDAGLICWLKAIPLALCESHTLWERNITNPSDETIRIVASAKNTSKGSYILAVSDEYLISFHSKNGTLVSVSEIPCSWTVDVKLVGPWQLDNNDTQWTLICEFGDSVETGCRPCHLTMIPNYKVRKNNTMGAKWSRTCDLRVTSSNPSATEDPPCGGADTKSSQ